MILFFDIDGTLWDYNNVIPKSTIEGIRRARKNGHKCFINTGRARAFVNSRELLGIGFDGIITACGTMIEYNDEVVFKHSIKADSAEMTVNTVRKYGFKPILEGSQFLYMERKDFEGDMYGEKVMKDMGENLRGIDECWGNWDMQKLSCATDVPKENRDKCFAELSGLYDFIIHSDTVVEMVPSGFNKGTAITRVCELLNADISDTFAFGDSVNDKEMLLAAGVGVAMGDTYHDMSLYADYVTTAQNNDGIYNALKHFELI